MNLQNKKKSYRFIQSCKFFFKSYFLGFWYGADWSSWFCCGYKLLHYKTSMLKWCLNEFPSVILNSSLSHFVHYIFSLKPSRTNNHGGDQPCSLKESSRFWFTIFFIWMLAESLSAAVNDHVQAACLCSGRCLCACMHICALAQQTCAAHLRRFARHTDLFKALCCILFRRFGVYHRGRHTAQPHCLSASRSVSPTLTLILFIVSLRTIGKICPKKVSLF